MNQEPQPTRIFLGRHRTPIRVRVSPSDGVGRTTRLWLFDTVDGVHLGTIGLDASVRLLDPAREELEALLDLICLHSWSHK